MEWIRSRLPDLCAEPQTALRSAQTLLSVAAAMGRLGAWAIEVPGFRLTWSDEVCAIHGLPAGSSRTVPQAVEFCAPPYRDAFIAALATCANEGTRFDLEQQIVTAQDEHLWVRTVGAPERDAGGRIVRVHGALQDITRTKRDAQRTEELAERLTLTLDSMTEGFFMLDHEARFTYVNAHGERVLRRGRDQLLGQVVFDVLPGALAAAFQQHYEQARSRCAAAEFEAFYPSLRAWLHVHISPSTLGVGVSFRDVTQRVERRCDIMRVNVELEERVRERTAQLQAANAEMEAFSYSVAHDLRSPLAAINGYSQMLEEQEAAPLRPRGRHYLQRIGGAARQMEEMTEGLLALARLSRAPLKRAKVDLAPVAARILERRRECDAARWVAAEVMPGLWAEGDVVLLTQMLDNLISNAWKFTARQPDARIRVGVKTVDDDEPVYFVEDNGAGFDMAYAQRLFEPFQRLHSTSEFEGTGIGLATVRKIVCRHGGRIWAEAQPERGATFYFTLAPSAAQPAL